MGNNFDKKFRDKILKHQFDVSEQDWQHMQVLLSGGEGGKARSFYILSGIATAFVALFLIQLYLFGYNDATQTKRTIIAQEEAITQEHAITNATESHHKTKIITSEDNTIQAKQTIKQTTAKVIQERIETSLPKQIIRTKHRDTQDKLVEKNIIKNTLDKKGYSIENVNKEKVPTLNQKQFDANNKYSGSDAEIEETEIEIATNAENTIVPLIDIDALPSVPSYLTFNEETKFLKSVKRKRKGAWHLGWKAGISTYNKTYSGIIGAFVEYKRNNVTLSFESYYTSLKKRSLEHLVMQESIASDIQIVHDSIVYETKQLRLIEMPLIFKGHLNNRHAFFLGVKASYLQSVKDECRPYAIVSKKDVDGGYRSTTLLNTSSYIEGEDPRSTYPVRDPDIGVVWTTSTNMATESPQQMSNMTLGGFHRWSIGLLIGYEFTFSPKFSLDIRYNQGLADLTKNGAFFLQNNPQVLNSNFNITLRQRFR